jgi:alkaline phosphatase
MMRSFLMKNVRLTLLLAVLLGGSALAGCAQNEYMDPANRKLQEQYLGGDFYPVKHYRAETRHKRPKNLILMIGDGMGLAQVYAGLTANGGHLFLENFKHIGFSKTYSADNYITDSAAGGTALACGEKTYNGAIGVNLQKEPIVNIRELAERKGLETGLVSTSAITHATPASFIAHQPSRNSYEAIAADFLNSGIDVFIGGGTDHFEKRKDGRNLSEALRADGYQVLYDMDAICRVTSGKLAGLTAPVHNPAIPERGNMLIRSTQTALNILSKNRKGYFIMIEGSQIDWGGHANKTPYVVQEMLDFDQAIGAALEFAARDGETLIIVTADHETGGMSINGGDMKTGNVLGQYTTGHHSGIMVPVYAFGPGADLFTGIMENTDIQKKIKALLEL